MTDVDRKTKTKNIVVRCLRPYKGYGLLRERTRIRSIFLKHVKAFEIHVGLHHVVQFIFVAKFFAYVLITFFIQWLFVAYNLDWII